ncbi:MAG: four helix bundle protein [Chloroflexi bacterium]|nr:four helix bundle protein [Chloroflexota bacterium]MDL1942304.1 four helix bundle protein [Chloroflexi bacterium CFX2]
MSVSGLEKLDVWCRARDFAVRVHKELLPLLPLDEKWALSQQIRRSSQSIPANIAEGHGRFYFQDNVRFCYIARGSLEETLSHIVHAYKVGYIPEVLYQALTVDGENLNRLINGYIGFLKKSKQGANEPGANYSVREMSTDYIFEENLLSSSDSSIE